MLAFAVRKTGVHQNTINLLRISMFNTMRRVLLGFSDRIVIMAGSALPFPVMVSHID